MRAPLLAALLLAMLPGCPAPPSEPAPDPSGSTVRVIARLGDPSLKGPAVDRLELTRLAGVSRPALCFGSWGHFELTVPPQSRRLRFSVGVKHGTDETEVGNFRFILLRPRSRRRPDTLLTAVVPQYQLGWLEQSVALPPSDSAYPLRFEISSGVGPLQGKADSEGAHSGCWASIVIEG